MKKYKETLTAERLRQLKGKMTYREFGELVGIGDSTLYNYLIKDRDIPLRMARKIARATGCDLNWLAGIKDFNSINLNMILKKNLDELARIGKKLEGLCYEKTKKPAKNHVRGV